MYVTNLSAAPLTKTFFPRAMIISFELEQVTVAFFKSETKSKVYAPLTVTLLERESPESFIVLPLIFKPSMDFAPLTFASVFEDFLE